jgi:DNA-directed RNA polymerase alpha subunit
MLHPGPELPDDALISRIDFPTRIRNALYYAGLNTVGEVRESSDEMLLSLPDLGSKSVALVRETLGQASCNGVRSAS